MNGRVLVIAVCLILMATSLLACTAVTPSVPQGLQPQPAPSTPVACGTPNPTLLPGLTFPQPDEYCLEKIQTTVTPDPNFPSGQFYLKKDGWIYYSAQSGDNLFRVAIKYDTSPEQIKADNPGLTEPPPVNYVIKIRLPATPTPPKP